MLALVASALLMGVGAPDPQPAAGAAPQVQAQAQAAKPKKICRSEVGTGSILPKRTCLTQQEWDARAAATANDADALRRGQGARSAPGSTN